MKIKVETIKPFTYSEFDKIKDSIVRKGIDTPGQLNVGDIFVCDKETAEYLTGKNERGNVVVRVIEVIPEKKKKTSK